MAKVLNIKDCNYKVPSGAVYVGRAVSRYNLPASKWGNPFRMNDPLLPAGLTREGKRKAVVAEYESYLMNTVAGKELLKSLPEIKNKNLVCWCHTWDGQGNNPMYCHADILLELANQPPPKP